MKPIDPYDIRLIAERDMEKLQESPELLAVYEIIAAFNKHKHEGWTLAQVRGIYRIHRPNLGNRVDKILDVETESYFKRGTDLSDTEYNTLLMKWTKLRKSVHGGRSFVAYMLILLGLVILAVVYLSKHVHK